jgi:hypothetical protein
MWTFLVWVGERLCVGKEEDSEVDMSRSKINNRGIEFPLLVGRDVRDKKLIKEYGILEESKSNF